jgi:hypothetical protein
MPVIALWVACAIPACFIAKSRGATNAPTWAVVGLLLGPIGTLLALVGARTPDPSIVPLNGRNLALTGVLSLLAGAAWLVVGFAVTILVAWPLEVGRAQNDPARTQIGVEAFGAGAILAIVGIVLTVRASRQRMADRTASPRPAQPVADRGPASSGPGPDDDRPTDPSTAPSMLRSWVRRLLVEGVVVAIGTTYIYAIGDTLFYVESIDLGSAAVGLAALP